MAKSRIFSTSGEYKSTYYSRGYRSWSGKTAHNKISKMIDELSDADAEKFRKYYEELGENYDKSLKFNLYDIVNSVDKGMSMDSALIKNRLAGNDDTDTTDVIRPNPF